MEKMNINNFKEELTNIINDLIKKSLIQNSRFNYTNIEKIDNIFLVSRLGDFKIVVEFFNTIENIIKDYNFTIYYNKRKIFISDYMNIDTINNDIILKLYNFFNMFVEFYNL